MEIKGNTRQQKHATAAQRLQMVEQFRRSGLSRAAFSRQRGIPLATLNWWLAKTKRASNLPVPNTFSEVTLAPPEATSSNAWAMEIVAPSGLMVRCREPLPMQDLGRLLRDTRC
jgi:transposase-like protein